jgi:hypothetical protein
VAQRRCHGWQRQEAEDFVLGLYNLILTYVYPSLMGFKFNRLAFVIGIFLSGGQVSAEQHPDEAKRLWLSYLIDAKAGKKTNLRFYQNQFFVQCTEIEMAFSSKSMNNLMADSVIARIKNEHVSLYDFFFDEAKFTRLGNALADHKSLMRMINERGRGALKIFSYQNPNAKEPWYVLTISDSRERYEILFCVKAGSIQFAELRKFSTL